MMSRARPQLLTLLGVGTTLALLLSLAFLLRPRAAPAAVHERARSTGARAAAAPVASLASPAPPPEASRFLALPALRFETQGTRESLELRLYDAAGNIDEAAAERLDRLLCDARDPKQRRVGRLARRTLQLVYRAAYHFQAHDVEVVSAYREPGRRREGPHGSGSAIDFRLRGVKAAELAQFLRASPRTGVGVYTHPKTQYVHLDVREQSFHWLDASPPRRRWREKSIGDKLLVARDTSYAPAMDLPEIPAKAAGAR